MNLHIYLSRDLSATWIAIISIVLSVVGLFVTVYWNRRSERRGYLDQFWFRQVFAPSCLEPVIKFRQQWNVRISKMNDPSEGDVKSMLRDFGSEKDAVLRSLWMSKLFFKDYYNEACVFLDGAEDGLAEKIGAWLLKKNDNNDLIFPCVELNSLISKSCISVVSSAAMLHGKRLTIRKSWND